MRIPHTLIRWLGALSLAAATAVVVTACGGGGDGGSGGGAPVSGGGGGSGGSGSSMAANTTTITVDQGIGGSGLPNIPTVSVTVCAPGTSNCQVVDHVLVDTGSYGLRLVGDSTSTLATSGLLASLPRTSVGGGPLAECGAFVTSFTWGSVRTVDLKINGERANSLPVQIIGDLGMTSVPTSCSNGGTSANSAAALGANGIIGIGPKPYDCGPACTTSTSGTPYYACPGGNSTCTPTTVPLQQQIANPVPRFAVDNNGVIIRMAAISSGGQPSATGTLIFGIGTQSNNVYAASTKLLSTTTGDVGALFLGKNVTAFFDTGSNAYFFDDPALPKCSGNASFYCSAGTVQYSATLSGLNGAQGTITMSVANANSLFSNNGAFAFDDLGGPFSSSPQSTSYQKWLDIGLPHFYGKSIYFGMDLTQNGGAAPYVAF